MIKKFAGGSRGSRAAHACEADGSKTIYEDAGVASLIIELEGALNKLVIKVLHACAHQSAGTWRAHKKDSAKTNGQLELCLAALNCRGSC